jgi:hypothetical protein
MAKRRAQTQIKTVSFRANVDIEKFRHVHVEASADVPAGVDPRSVVDDLKAFVAAELRRAKEGEVPASVRSDGRFQIY